LTQPWADGIGAVTNSDWVSSELAEQGPFLERFHQALGRAIGHGGRILFNLDDLNLDQALSADPFTDPFDDGITNWELQQVLHDKQYYLATDFYLGGQKLLFQDTLDFGLTFRGRAIFPRWAVPKDRRDNKMKAIAEKLLSYYTRMESRNGGDWKANIDAARMWLSLLAVDDPPDAEIEDLLSRLHIDTIHRGTAWEEMEMHVQQWVRNVRQKRPASNVGKNHVAQSNR
jgi:hypothetical protein